MIGRPDPALYAPPPGYPPSAPWPPAPVEAVAMAGRASKRACRVPSVAPSLHMSLASSRAAYARGDADLYRAFGTFAALARLSDAKPENASHRVIAACNAAPTLAALGNVHGLDVARAELRRAWPSAPPFDGAMELITVASQMVDAARADMSRGGAMRWSARGSAGGFLASEDSWAADRVGRLPHDFVGPWPEIVRMLACWGLRAPAEGPEGELRARATSAGLIVT